VVARSRRRAARRLHVRQRRLRRLRVADAGWTRGSRLASLVARGATCSKRAPSPGERARGAVGGGPGASAYRKETSVTCTRAHCAAPTRAGMASRSALRGAAPRRSHHRMMVDTQNMNQKSPNETLPCPRPGIPMCLRPPAALSPRGAGRPAARRRGGVGRARPGLGFEWLQGCKRWQPCRKPPRQSEDAASRREPPRKPPERIGHVAARAPVVQRVGVLVFFRSQGSLPLAGHRGSLAPHQSAASLHHLMAFRRSSIESPSQTSRPVRS
jgi:hypothetical protein